MHCIQTSNLSLPWSDLTCSKESWAIFNCSSIFFKLLKFFSFSFCLFTRISCFFCFSNRQLCKVISRTVLYRGIENFRKGKTQPRDVSKPKRQRLKYNSKLKFKNTETTLNLQNKKNKTIINLWPFSENRKGKLPTPSVNSVGPGFYNT